MNICDILYIYMIYVVTQGGKDESKEGEFNLLFYAIKTRNHDAFAVVLQKSDFRWQNSIGVFALVRSAKTNTLVDFLQRY